jgi:hypothetical protein
MRFERWTTLGLLLVVVACSSTTDPTKPTPTPSATPDPTKPWLRAFAAAPDRITKGDDFTLTWEGKNGTVSLARKGESPFVAGLPSSGSHVLRSGASGYPTATGAAAYEATIGDMAQRLETTVTVVSPPMPMPTPSLPTVSISGGGSCHPSSHEDPCPVQFSASGSDYTSLAWSGCCSGTTAESICVVDGIGTFTCSVTATGPGGTASASGTANGINDTPSCVADMVDPDPPLCCDLDATFSFTVHDDQQTGQTCRSVSAAGGACYCPPSGCSLTYCGPVGDDMGIEAKVKTGPATGRCVVKVEYTDVWGSSKQCSKTVSVGP